MGYHRAGFEVVGVDIKPQPNYPFEFHQLDALEVHFSRPDVFTASRNRVPLGDFDLVHASPPCQAYTAAQTIRNREHPDLIAPTREMLIDSGVPYVIENVVGAPLKNPITLCGAMFGLRTYRHRLFETSFDVAAPSHREHRHPQAKMGRAPKDGEFIQVVGNFSNVAYARKAMDIDWMTRDELREAIPPAYTEFIGLSFLEAS